MSTKVSSDHRDVTQAAKPESLDRPANKTSSEMPKDDKTTKQTPKDNEKPSATVDPEELIDMDIFDQLLEMDDEEDHEFSWRIVCSYFEQANSTFDDMDAALKKKDLPELSRLGHFLKGSSAAIGLKKVKATCEKIQNIGNQQDDTGAKLDEAEAVKQITELLPQVKAEYSEAEDYLKHFYSEQEGR